LIGLKLRQSRDVVGELGLDPLKAAIEIAEDISCPIAVHTTDPPSATDDLVELLRPGDVFVHAYHGVGNTILGANRQVLPAVRKARERGVLFDAANGRNHFSFDTAFAALADGFVPDIISTDLTTLTWNKPPAHSLPFIISKYLNMGVALPAALAACTSVPARLLGMTGVIGTLAPGAVADIAILRLEERDTEFLDSRGQKHMGNQLLIPQATVRAGHIVYRNCGCV
jgi:predicted amidohydrolase